MISEVILFTTMAMHWLQTTKAANSSSLKGILVAATKGAVVTIAIR